MKIRVLKYLPENAVQWNAFVEQSVNGTFLFDRGFMDYHQERFENHSLMFFADDELICCIPAHINGCVFYSHRGLSYGGLILNSSGVVKIDEVIDGLLKYLKSSAFAKAELQQSPSSYHAIHKEIGVRLQQKGFTLNRVLHNQWVQLDQEIQLSPKKTRGYRNGKFEGLIIEKGNDLESFWKQVLEPQLAARHDSKPVHRLEEIELLASRFPMNIIQHNVYRENQLLAGITFFIKNDIVKSQYTASSPIGLKTDAAGYMYMEAMKEFQEKGYRMMDYGSVNERDGSVNEGLLRFKKELGCEQEEWGRWEVEL